LDKLLQSSSSTPAAPQPRVSVRNVADEARKVVRPANNSRSDLRKRVQ